MERSGSFRRGGCGRLVRAMARCECAELSFAEIERRVQAGQPLDEVQADTGVGLLCSACLPDLREHLEDAGAAAAPPSSVRSSDPDEDSARLVAAADPR